MFQSRSERTERSAVESEVTNWKRRTAWQGKAGAELEPGKPIFAGVLT